MPSGGSLVVLANGQNISIDLTGSAGTRPTAKVAGSTISFPYTVSADTAFNFAADDTITVSAMIGGVETVNRKYRFTNNDAVVLAPSTNDFQQAPGAGGSGVTLETSVVPPGTNTTAGLVGSAITAARSDHAHALGSHDHTTTAKGGTLPLGALSATGTRDTTTYLRGDGTFAVPPGSAGAGAKWIPVVAAADAPALVKANADYVCDGTADQADINTALSLHKRVNLTEGTFWINGSITIPTRSMLSGAGRGTVIKGTAGSLPNNGAMIKLASVNGDKVTIRDLALDGNFTTMSGITCHGISLDNTGATASPWFADETDTHHKIENVYVKQCNGDGIRLVCGTGATPEQRQSHLIGCEVYDVTGDGISIAGVTDGTMIDCTVYAGGYGFNIGAGSAQVANWRIVGSKAFYSGYQDKTSQATIKSGWRINGNRNVFVSCEAQDNMLDGFWIAGGQANRLDACNADGNGRGTDNNGTNTTAYGFRIDAQQTSITGMAPNYNGLQKYSVAVFQGIGTHVDLDHCSATLGYVDGDSYDYQAVIRINGQGGYWGRSNTTTGTLPPDPYLYSNYNVTLSGSLTIANPTRKHAGQTLRFILRQDGAGGRTVSWGNQFAFPTGWGMTTTANAVTVVEFMRTQSEWQLIDFVDAALGTSSLPGQAGQSGKALVTNGTFASWGFVSAVDGVNSLLGWRVVTDPAYGAVGDGATDDGPAIRAAITACPVGGTVYFPPGKTYIVATATTYTAALSITKSLTLRGEPTSVIKAKSATSTGIRLVQVSTSDVTIHGLGFDGNSITDVTCVYGTGASRLNITDCNFTRPGSGALHCNDNCTDILFAGNRVVGQGYGVLVNTGAGHARIKIDANTFDGQGNPGDAVEINGTTYPRYDITCTGNTVANYVDSGPASGFGIGYSYVVRGTIANNVVSNCSRNGIHVENLCSGVTVVGNTVTNTRHAGIEVQGEAGQTSSLIVINGNTISNCCTTPTIHLGNGGIDIGSSTGGAFAGFGAVGIECSNNIIDGCRGAGIYAFQVSNSHISNNIIRNTYGVSTDTAHAVQNTGIEAVSCYNSDFVGNRIFDDQTTKTQYYPMYFYGGNTGTRAMMNNCSGNIGALTDVTAGIYQTLNV